MSQPVLDGDSVYLVITVKEPDGSTTEKRSGPFLREMADLMLRSAKQQPWYADGKIVEAKRD